MQKVEGYPTEAWVILIVLVAIIAGLIGAMVQAAIGC